MKPIDLGLRALQVCSRKPVDRSVRITDVDGTVPLDPPYHGARGKYDCRRQIWEPIHRELCHVCLSVCNAHPVLLDRCDHL